MNDLELISFQIISAVGSARSNYINAIQEAKKGDFDEAQRLLSEGEELFVGGHQAHMKLLTKQANNEKLEFDLLLVHAEDQMMSAESFKIIAEEIIELYKIVL